MRTNLLTYLLQVWRRRKNFIALSIGFLLIYTAFRSIQALQSSINAAGRLGVVAMACVHGTMAIVCPLLAPTVSAGRPPPKWTVVLAAVLYVGWMTANLWPHPFTLLPASLVAGVAQCIGWAALIAFMRSLQRDEVSPSHTSGTSNFGEGLIGPPSLRRGGW